MKILAVQRDTCFSPHSEAKDEAILKAVIDRLAVRGHAVESISECCLPVSTVYDFIFSMGRHPQTLHWLSSQSAPVINAPQSVARCTRSRLQRLMTQLSIPQPSAEGTHGYWLKRGDATAQQAGDIVFAADKTVLQHEIDVFRQRGITDYTVSAHVQGDVLKFYGVRSLHQSSLSFFRYYYPTDDGDSKFGDEQYNGAAHHYPFLADDLRLTVERLSEALGICVFGGDAIICQDGSFCMIDFNDWPSFSRCREEAADEIVKLIDDVNI